MQVRVARLDRENAGAEGRHGDLATMRPEGRRQRLERFGGAVLRCSAHGLEHRLQIGGLVMLFGGKRDADHGLGDARLDTHGHGRAFGSLAPEDLERAVVHGR